MPDQPEDQVAPPPDIDAEAEAALREAVPSWMKDGYGLRGPNPMIGKPVEGMDGADGGFGDLQVKGEPWSRDDPPDPQRDQDQPPLVLLKDVVYMDTSENPNELFYVDLYTNGRRDAV